MPENVHHFNQKELVRRFGESSVKEVVQIYLDESPALVREFVQATQSGDSQRVCDAAHSIKGSLGMLCAKTLAELAEELITLVKLAKTRELESKSQLFISGLESLQLELQELSDSL